MYYLKARISDKRRANSRLSLKTVRFFWFVVGKHCIAANQNVDNRDSGTHEMAADDS